MTQYIAINNEQDQTFKLEHPSGSGALTVTSKEIYDAIHPRTLTETATFTGIDNKIVMTGIVTALQLEVGDVIQFSNAISQNNKPRTVESITDADTIIVNYEHCGARGDGSLKLTDEAVVSATVKLLAKWFVAPIGLGQALVAVTSFRDFGVSYVNNTNRTISAIVEFNQGNLGVGFLYQETFKISNSTPPTGYSTLVNGNIQVGKTYKYEKQSGLQTFQAWSELR